MTLEEYQKREYRIIGITAIVAIVVVIFGIKYLLSDDDNHRAAYTRSYAYAQILVKDELKSPKSAKFPMYNKSFVEYDEATNTATVRSYVDAENSFGATVRTQYVAIITLSGNEPTGGFVTLK